VAVLIKTSRGNYLLKPAGLDQQNSSSIVLTLVLERADGIERIAFRCRIAKELLEPVVDADAILARVAPWLEREFEMTREKALRTIRGERKMLEVAFDANSRGPF
jgi:hypothetical protein